MTFAKSLRRASAALALIAIAAGCSPSSQKKDEAPAPETAAPAVPETSPAATPAAPTAGDIPLDIKDAAGKQLSGDPARGLRVFRQCQTCHTVDAGVNRVGPSLHAIVGRRAGSVEGFHYSEANKTSGITWTEQELYAYLENPRATVPGTLMSFVGLRDSQQRADVIAYLQENTK